MKIKSIITKTIKDSAVAPFVVLGGVCKGTAVTLIACAKGARKTADTLDKGSVYCAIKGAQQDAKVVAIREKQDAKVVADALKARQTDAYNASCDVYDAERALRRSQRKFESAERALAGNTITEQTPEKVFVQEVMNASATEDATQAPQPA